MMTEINEKSISRQLSRNVGGQRNLLVRVLPLFLKKLFVPMLYKRLGENLCSGTISNLGLITMHDEMAQIVEKI